MDHTNNLYITICSYIETGFLPFRERKKERKKKRVIVDEGTKHSHQLQISFECAMPTKICCMKINWFQRQNVSKLSHFNVNYVKR